MVHHLAFATSDACDQVGEGYAVQHSADSAIDVSPYQLEVAGFLVGAVVIEVARLQAGQLDEGTADAPDDVADCDLLGQSGQDVAAFVPRLLRTMPWRFRICMIWKRNLGGMPWRSAMSWTRMGTFGS